MLRRVVSPLFAPEVGRTGATAQTPLPPGTSIQVRPAPRRFLVRCKPRWIDTGRPSDLDELPGGALANRKPNTPQFRRAHKARPFWSGRSPKWCRKSLKLSED